MGCNIVLEGVNPRGGNEPFSRISSARAAASRASGETALQVWASSTAEVYQRVPELSFRSAATQLYRSVSTVSRKAVPKRCSALRICS